MVHLKLVPVNDMAHELSNVRVKACHWHLVEEPSDHVLDVNHPVRVDVHCTTVRLGTCTTSAIHIQFLI